VHVTVVATTGGRDPSQLRDRLPMNTYVAECIPHDVLLANVDVMVTNRGYRDLRRARELEAAFCVATVSPRSRRWSMKWSAKAAASCADDQTKVASRLLVCAGRR
jgi:hypothetical protein